MRIIHLAANDQYGCFEINPIDYPERELKTPEDFIYSFKEDMGLFETIFTAVTEGSPEHDLIKNEFGLK